ncbi:hypothetical protein E2C01_066076 [Portunus trituberculatus]|uniref:Secreted protein n=1 Tax=Portunus trituberculatus TaxID=210409 RepID=A0A5B7HRB7_PORTR|nr:hypothetical protein [Portunus trituberculatus]
MGVPLAPLLLLDRLVECCLCSDAQVVQLLIEANVKAGSSPSHGISDVTHFCGEECSELICGIYCCAVGLPYAVKRPLGDVRQHNMDQLP